MARKLNLGCGEFKKPGFINIDIVGKRHPDIIGDLAERLPFLDGVFDCVEADHLLEHLPDPFAVMEEIQRVMRPGGILRVRVPHFSRGFTLAQHKSGFDVTFPLYFNPSFKGGYTGVEFDLQKMRLTWFAQLELKRTVLNQPIYLLMRSMGFFIDLLANLSPAACSRIWCFWVGGFDEIFFEFRK